MRSIRVHDTVGPAGAVTEVGPDPVRGADEVKVEVRAVAASFPDLLMSQGKYHLQPTAPFTLGSDFAGLVLEAPAGSHLAPGDRVAGFLDFGAAAEITSAQAPQVYPLPPNVSWAQGAALPMNYLTAHFALVKRGGLAAGDVVLVHGAAGGVGVAALQVARGLGARTIAVVSSDAKAEIARRAVADHVINSEDLPAAPRELTEGRGVDVVIDVVGGGLMTDSLRSLAPLGRVMVVGFASGEIPVVKVNRLLMSNIDVRGVELSYMVDSRQTLSQWHDLAPLMESGVIAPIIDSVRPLAEFGSGLQDIDDRRLLGRAVFTI